MGSLAPLILNLGAKWRWMVSVSLLPFYSLGKSLSTHSKGNQSNRSKYYPRKKIENKLNGVMTVRVRFKFDLVCYLETLTSEWNIQSCKFSCSLIVWKKNWSPLEQNVAVWQRRLREFFRVLIRAVNWVWHVRCHTCDNENWINWIEFSFTDKLITHQ